MVGPGGEVLVYGGANFDGVMAAALMRAAPWIDYAVAGEADLAGLVMRDGNLFVSLAIPATAGR